MLSSRTFRTPHLNNGMRTLNLGEMKTNLKKTANVFTFDAPMGVTGVAESTQKNKLSSFNDFACVPNANVKAGNDESPKGSVPFYF